MKVVQILLMLLIVSGCSLLKDGLFSKSHDLDSNEYYQSVELQFFISDAKDSCGKFQDIKAKIAVINKRLRILNLYISGKSHNRSVLQQTNLMINSLNKIQNKINKKGRIGETYCIEKLRNLELMSDTLRKSIISH